MKNKQNYVMFGFPGFQQLNKEKISTGRIKPAFFCQILVIYMLYMLYLCGTIGMR